MYEYKKTECASLGVIEGPQSIRGQFCVHPNTQLHPGKSPWGVKIQKTIKVLPSSITNVPIRGFIDGPQAINGKFCIHPNTQVHPGK